MVIKKLCSHGHEVLDFRDTPDGFLSLVSKYIHKNLHKRSEQIQKWLNAFSYLVPRDKLRYLSQYLDTLDNTDEERMEYNLQFFDMVFCYCVDLHYMGAGKCSRDYDDQIAAAVHLKKQNPGRVKIFMMLDPNRPNLMELVKKWHTHIDGWKLYPTWYYVTDIRLRPIFNAYPKPVVVHCTNTSPVYFQGSRNALKRKLGENAYKYKTLKSKKWNCQFFSHPSYVYEMSIRYPNINWSCEHMGGTDKVLQDYILERLGGNFYTGDAFTFTTDEEIKQLVPIVEEHSNIMHGTDYFMTLVKGEYIEQIRSYNMYMPQRLQRKQVESALRFIGEEE